MNYRHEIASTPELADWYDDYDHPDVPEIDIGWLAGILDGEGSVRISKAAPKKHPKPSAQYSVEAHAVTNTDDEIIRRVRRLLDALDVPHRVYSIRTTSRKDRQTFWKAAHTVRVWTVRGIQKFLLLMLPHLTGNKKLRAELVLQFIAIPKPRSYGKGRRPEALTTRYEALYQQQPFRSGSAPDRAKNGIQKAN